MDYYLRIAGNFQQAIEAIAMSVDSLAPPIEQAATAMTGALLADGKIMACGSGPDAALAQLLVSNLLDRLDHERPALPGMSLGLDAASLTAMADSNGLEDIYARQVRALGNAGDVLVAIASGPLPASLDRALRTAAAQDIRTVLLSITDSDATLPDVDVQITVEVMRRPRAVELHTMIIQCLCELIEINLFGTSAKPEPHNPLRTPRFMNKLLLSLLLSSALLLGGCGSMLASMEANKMEEDQGKRTFGQQIEDETIETKAMVNIRDANDAFDEAHLVIVSYNGYVLIVGQVPHCRTEGPES